MNRIAPFILFVIFCLYVLLMWHLTNTAAEEDQAEPPPTCEPKIVVIDKTQRNPFHTNRPTITIQEES